MADQENQVQDVDANISAEAATADNTVPVYDLDFFLTHVTGWHFRKLDALNHFLEIPAGTEAGFKMNDGPEVKVMLEGAALDGFKLGIITALNEIGQLPFVSRPVDPEAGEQMLEVPAVAEEGKPANDAAG